jgi:hypothetical protein
VGSGRGQWFAKPYQHCPWGSRTPIVVRFAAHRPPSTAFQNPGGVWSCSEKGSRKLRSTAVSSALRSLRWSSSAKAIKRNGCKQALSNPLVGCNISAMPWMAPDRVWKAISTKSPVESCCCNCSNPPLMEMDCSFARARWPSSANTAAVTDPRSSILGERRVALLWGK